MLHYIQNKSTFFMLITFTLLFGTVGFLYCKSKNEIPPSRDDHLENIMEKKEVDDLYKDLEDLFI